MTSRKRFLLMAVIAGIFILLVKSIMKINQTRDKFNDSSLDSLVDIRDAREEPIEPRDKNEQTIVEKRGAAHVSDSERPIHKMKFDNPDEEYNANLAIAEMQVEGFKQQMQDDKSGIGRNDEEEDGANPGGDIGDTDKGADDENFDAEADDYDYDEDYNIHAIMQLFNGKNGKDKKKRHEMIEKMRKWLPKAFPMSYNKKTAQRTHEGAHVSLNLLNNKETVNPSATTPATIPSLNLLNNDGLVRMCITGDVIGRIPSNLKTRLFTHEAGRPVKRSPEDGAERIESFNSIFHDKTWGASWEANVNGLAASGRGATLIWTQEVMASLHTVISHIKSTLGISRVRILDAPCGDMAWMSRFLETRDDVTYVGADIVSDMIESHNKNYKGRGWTFMYLDLVEDDIPGKFDLIFSRTLLQHLYHADVLKILQKFSQSGSKYLLTTTFSKQIYNAELDFVDNPGRVREINLEIPPFSLIPPICIQRDGPPNDFEGWNHFVGLWELPLKQLVNCDQVKHFRMMGTQQDVYSCVEWSPYINLN